MIEKRNTSKEKRKENKKFPYKQGGRNRTNKKLILSLVLGISFLFAIILIVGAFDWVTDIDSYYKLDGSSGAVVDSVGIYDGTNSGTATRGVAGKIGTAFQFDGSGDWVELGTRIDGRPITWNFWVAADDWNPGSVSSDNQIILGHGWSGAPYLCNVGDDQFGRDSHLRCYCGGTYVDVDVSGWSNSTWHMITTIVNTTGGYLYSNSALVSFNAGCAGSTPDVLWQLGKKFTDTTNYFDGKLDEIGFWNKSLSPSEIIELYNSGSGLTYGTTPPLVLLFSPTNQSVFSETETDFLVNLSITGTATDLEWVNATYNIWFNNGTVFNITTNSSLSGNQTNITQHIQNLTVGNYLWNCYACHGNATYSNCSWGDDGNFSFEFLPFEEDAESHTTTVIETSYQTFELNITSTEGYTVSNGRLVYNGTTYPHATKTIIDSDSFNLIQRIYIPSGDIGFNEENRSFYWNITTTNEATGISSSFTSNTYYQNVTELKFQLCAGNTNVTLLNFTLYDEGTGSVINGSLNATTFQATFNISASSENKIKTYSINNLSISDSSFAFCTNSNDSIIYSDMEAFYTAEGYTDKQYFLNNATLTNTTSNINLYLLAEDDALEFFITVEQDLNPLAGVTVNIAKYFVGEGVYKTVEIDETDTDGEFTAYLDLDKKYKFTITRDGSVLGSINKRASCDAAPCEILLSFKTAISNPFENFATAFASNVLYNLSFNSGTKIVTFDFIDTTGLATYFRMVVYNSQTNQSSISIYDNSLYTSSGSMSFNVTDYSGDFRAETYISRSPEILIDFITFIIGTVAETLGIVGLFTALILVLVVIFGFSFKPSMLVMAVPLALTVFKLAAIISLSGTSLIFIYVLAIIALFALSK